MKLGGWQRLWILLSIIWLLPVALFTLEAMSIEFRGKADQLESGRLSAITDLIQKEASQVVKMADGAMILFVPKGISKEDLEQLDARYMKYVEAETAELFEGLEDIVRPVPPGNTRLFSDLIRELPVQGAQAPKALRAPRVGHPADVQALVQRKHEEYGKWIDFSEIESRYKKNLRQLRWEKAKIGMYGVLAWLTSIGLLYLLGVAIGWIVRGFKTK